MTSGVDELLERVRSQRTLPVPAERRRIRMAAKLTLRDVAVALGVSHTAVAAWGAGSTPREQHAAYARLLTIFSGALKTDACDRARNFGCVVAISAPLPLERTIS